jgi:hypothetical protein
VRKKELPPEVLIGLQQRLAGLPARSHNRRLILHEAAELYGVSEPSLYRALAQRMRPKALRRSDRGLPRVLPQEQMEHYCELIAALKVRTSNKKGRHLSTGEAVRLLEEFGIETPDGLTKVSPRLLKLSTVNRYLRQWGYDRSALARQPVAVRFQAERSNECWQFDMTPSDLKQVKEPSWVNPERGMPTLMLFSVVDDRSGASYQEYHCVYGEEVEAALRFLFNAMAPKPVDGFPFHGIPAMLYADNGPVTHSHVFQQVMQYLSVEVRTHMPAGTDGRRVTARAKGKVERPFRTVKEMHETLYHFHEPKSEEEANAWLLNFLIRYNNMEHRSEPHSRIEDWLQNLPPSGVRAMCTWERFCTFAREPERRKVGSDARVTIAGVLYEVDPELAGEEVVLWWGLFDNELYVEHGEKRFGPYAPVGGPIPLHRYRSLKKTRAEQRADRIDALAAKLALPRAAVEGPHALKLAATEWSDKKDEITITPFVDPDPFQELTYPNTIAAKRAISDYLGTPLAKLDPRQLAQIDMIVQATLNKKKVMEAVRQWLNRTNEEDRDVE